MRAEQALFGEVRGGHGLRWSTGDRQFASDIAPRLDLPDTAPPGVAWSPYISGFPKDGRYVLARTFRDSEAPRGGMVLAHAIILPSDELSRTVDLRPFLARLLSAADLEIERVAIEIELGTTPGPVSADLIPAANALTTRGSGPVVRIGIDGFEALVASLWANLWPDIRGVFSFRLSFGPKDIFEDPAPTVVCTPEQMLPRWVGYRLIDPATNDAKPTSAAAALLAAQSDSDELLRFARDIGADLSSLSDLPLLEMARQLHREGGNLDALVGMLRLVARLSPDPEQGLVAKNRLVLDMVTSIAEASLSQILALRNLPVTGVREPQRVWNAVEHRITALPPRAEHNQQFLSIAAEALIEKDADEDWRRAVKAGLAAGMRTAASAMAEAFWRLVEARPPILEPLLSLAPADGDFERVLSEATPRRVEQEIAEKAAELAVARGWLVLHGTVVAAFLSPIEAARRQLAVEPDTVSDIGLDCALRWATPDEILNAALGLGDTRLVERGARAVVSSFEIFAEVNIQSLTEQRVWAGAIALAPQAWRAPADPWAARNLVLTALIDGGKSDTTLVAVLSRTPLADLSDFKRRAELWPRLGRVRGAYLDATVSAWLRSARNGEIPFQPEYELTSALIAHFGSDSTLADLPAALASAIRVVEALPGFAQHRFLAWLRGALSRAPSLTPVEAEALGLLVAARRWQGAVDEMLAWYRKGRSDLRPTLRACASMLSGWTRWKENLSPPSLHEKWAVFEDLAAELYGEGPEQDNIWERAGGKRADLSRNVNARSNWRIVLGRVRNGGGPQPLRLLREMQTDYPSNDQLRLLASDRGVVGGGHGA